MSSTEQLTRRRRDPVALGAFLLALFLLFLTQPGVLDPLFRNGRFGLAFLVFGVLFVAVFAPFWVSVRRRRREPSIWGSFGFLAATGVILGLDILWFASVITYQFFR